MRHARPSCELSPCVNGGECVDLVSAPYYRCVCPPLPLSGGTPWTRRPPQGAHCELVSPCDMMPCPRQSTCVVVDRLSDDGYTCVCDGERCRHAAGAPVTSLRPRDYVLGASALLYACMYCDSVRIMSWYSVTSHRDIIFIFIDSDVSRPQ